MKKIIIIYVILMFVFVVGFSSNDKYQAERINNISNSFDKILPYFEKVELPIDAELFYGKSKKIPKDLNNLLNISTDSTVYAYLKFDIYNDFIGLIANISNSKEDSYCYSLFIANKNGNIINRIYLDINPDYGKYFELEENYMMKQYYYDQGFLQFWEYENGCADYMSAHDPKEIYTQEMKILNSGKTIIPDSFLVFSTVDKFLKDLSSQNFNEAFELQKNSNWGNFEHFSSDKAFGGITGIFVDELKFLSENGNTASVYCEAKYKDKINGDSYIKQNFLLSKINDKWLITGMKVISFEKVRQYFEPEYEFKNFEFSMSKIDKNGFNFYIQAVTYDECEDYGNVATEVEGKAKYFAKNKAIYNNGDCSFYFNFSENNEEVVLSAKNYKNKYKNLNLILNKTFKIR